MIENSEITSRTLQDLILKLADCTNCALSSTRENVIPGYGKSSADVMMIGAAVPYYLANYVKPFVGATGNTLNQLLEMLYINKDRLYLTNIIKCPLPKRDATSQDPSQQEIKACAPWLDEEIRIINPSTIITFGVPALQRFFPRESVSGFQKCMPKEKDGILYFALHHPANFQRGGSGSFASWVLEPINLIRQHLSEHSGIS